MPLTVPKPGVRVLRGLGDIASEMTAFADSKAGEDAEARRQAADVRAALAWLDHIRFTLLKRPSHA